MTTSISLYELLNNIIVGLALIILCLPLGYVFNDQWWVLFIAYIVGALYSKLNELAIGPLFRNLKSLIDCAEEKERKKKKNAYNQAYYNGWDQYCIANVSSLEALLAFVRNIWPIIIAAIFAIFFRTCIIYENYANSQICIIHSFKVSIVPISLMPIVCLIFILVFIAIILRIPTNLDDFRSCIQNIIHLLVNNPVFLFIIDFLCIIFIYFFPNSHCIKCLNIEDKIFTVCTKDFIRLLLILFFFLPQLGYYLQMKIYGLVFEHEKYK